MRQDTVRHSKLFTIDILSKIELIFNMSLLRRMIPKGIILFFSSIYKFIRIILIRLIYMCDYPIYRLRCILTKDT